MADDAYTLCAEQLAVTPRLVQQLLEDHSPAPDGTCQGNGCHAQHHPCAIRRLAELARAHQHRMRARVTT